MWGIGSPIEDSIYQYIEKILSHHQKTNTPASIMRAAAPIAKSLYAYFSPGPNANTTFPSYVWTGAVWSILLSCANAFTTSVAGFWTFVTVTYIFLITLHVLVELSSAPGN